MWFLALDLLLSNCRALVSLVEWEAWGGLTKFLFAFYLYGCNLIQHENMADSGNLYNGAVESEIMVRVQIQGIYFILGRSNLLCLRKVWRETNKCFISLCLLVQMKPGRGRPYLKLI